MSKIYVDEIRPKTSGSAVIFPDKPYVALDMGGGGSYESVALDAIFPFDNVYDGDSSLWDASSYEFTCPVAGLYLMTFIGLINTGTDMGIDFQKNNSTFVRAFVTSERGLQASHIVKCVANDTLRYRHAGATQTYYNGQTTSRYTAATIALIG